MSFLFLVTFVVLLLDPITDWYIIEKLRRPINHAQGALIVIGVLTLAIAWDMATELKPGLLRWYLGTRLPLLVMIPSIRWIVHDFFLNVLRGLPLGYLGKGEGSAKTDNFLSYIHARYNITQAAIKVIALVISLALALAISIVL